MTIKCPKEHPAYSLWRTNPDPEAWIAAMAVQCQSGPFDVAEWVRYAMDTAHQAGLGDC